MITKPLKIQIKVSQQELDLIRSKAIAAGYSTSEYLRLVGMGLQLP
jgi:hypothetical protein